MDLLTVADVAARLRCSRGLVYRLVAAGELPHYRVGGGRGGIRVSGGQLARFLAARTGGGRPPRPVRRLRRRRPGRASDI